MFRKKENRISKIISALLIISVFSISSFFSISAKTTYAATLSNVTFSGSNAARKVTVSFSSDRSDWPTKLLSGETAVNAELRLNGNKVDWLRPGQNSKDLKNLFSGYQAFGDTKNWPAPGSNVTVTIVSVDNKESVSAVGKWPSDNYSGGVIPGGNTSGGGGGAGGGVTTGGGPTSGGSQNLSGGSSPDFNMLDVLGEAGKVCALALAANILTTTILGGATKLLNSFISFEVPVSDAAQRVKDTGNPLGGVLDTPSLDGIGFCLLNATAEYVLNQTINWVKGGFNGGPLFVEDPEDFFGQMADEALGEFIGGLTDDILCKDISIQVKLALLLDYESDKADLCTLTEVIDNVTGFMDGNFSDGGWKGWFELTQYENNNFYGSFAKQRDAYRRIEGSNKNRFTFELGWGDGFLSFKDPLDPTKTTTPGRLLTYNIEQSLGIPTGRLTIADEFDELMVGIINILVETTFNEVFENGTDGLGGFGSTGGGSNSGGSSSGSNNGSSGGSSGGGSSSSSGNGGGGSNPLGGVNPLFPTAAPTTGLIDSFGGGISGPLGDFSPF